MKYVTLIMRQNNVINIDLEKSGRVMCRPVNYTQSVLIRNGPIRNTGEILSFFKK